MKINSASVILLALSTIILFSCTKSVQDTPTPVEAVKLTDVYVAGYNNGKIVYWKNGVETALATGPANFGTAYGLAVSGTDVYVAGKSNSNAMYWKNGLETPIFKETEGFKEARAIAVNGNDVYVTGVEVFSSTGQNAFLWKNGVKSIPTSEKYTGTRREGTGIALAGSDVYVSGTTGGTAVYWKNGVERVLSDQIAQATGIAVSGTDVYVSGREGIRAVYWKNGVKTVLTIDGDANGILVSGSDVFVVGVSDRQAVVWKNNVKTILDHSYSATATAIASNGKDIFIAGKIVTESNTTCVYWQNGIKKELVTVSNDPMKIATVSAIAVVTR